MMARRELVRTLLGFQETGDRWGIHPRSVKRAAERGEIRTVRIGRRVLIPITEILRIEESGRLPLRGQAPPRQGEVGP
jgi:hypothetical protein